MKFPAALLALVLAGCSSPQRLPPVEQLPVYGVTPRGVAWRAESWVVARDLESEIDAEATDTTWTVAAVSERFRAGTDHGLVEDLYEGVADPIERTIYVASPRVWGSRRQTLRHEYHHVTLFNQLGHVDPKHIDPSWDAGGYR